MHNKRIQQIEMHVHPFLETNSIGSIDKAMERARLDGIGLVALDSETYNIVCAGLKNLYPETAVGRHAARVPFGRVYLNASEHSTKEGFHLLLYGYTPADCSSGQEIRKLIDEGLRNDALVVLDHPFADNGWTKTAGHIDGCKEIELETICSEYKGDLAIEWNGYSIPWVRYLLMHAVNVWAIASGRKDRMHYHDINDIAEKFAEWQKFCGNSMPIIPDTDLHARTKGLLNDMGTSRILTRIEKTDPDEYFLQLKENIFRGEYVQYRGYVSLTHLVTSYCIPILFPKVFPKPRG